MTAPQELVEQALAVTRADGCVVLVAESSTANLRWANNTLTTNGVALDRQLTVIATVDGATGTAAGVVSSSGAVDDAVERVVRRAEAAARSAMPAEDAQPLIGGDADDSWTEPPQQTSIGVFAGFAPGLRDAFARAKAEGRVLYGFASHEIESTFVGTSAGLRRRHDQPTGYVEINAKSPDGMRSAWVGAPTLVFGPDLDLEGLDRELTTRLAWAERSGELPAGRYEAILPPGAVADLLINLYWAAGARDAHDGHSPFSRAGGGTRVGERLSATPFTLRSDPRAPGLECAPFMIAAGSGDARSVFDNGVALEATDWIRDGVMTALTQTRHSAALTGLPLTPYVDNLILEGDGQGGLDELVAATERGLLLTCLWYIREVDPRTLLLTGLTRDGVYLVEGGEVTGAVNNFRFNESPIDLLGRVRQVGATERTLPREWSDYFTRTAMPALRVADFTMSSVSQAR
ncbi:MAG: metallopeptidase TldD-related protein [Acidimicrobiales bacterium]